MRKSLKKLTEKQFEFIKTEFGLDKDALYYLTDNELEEMIYEPCCEIEEIEVCKTLDYNSELAERGMIAADIVTLFGNEIND